MTMENSMQDKSHKICSIHCVSWSAIIVGAFVGIGITFLLNLLGMGLGLTAFSVSKEGLQTLAVGGYVGMVVGGVISMFTAGWVSGYLSRAHCHKRRVGILYGFATWCLALILTVLLSSHVMQYVNYTATPTTTAVKASDTSTAMNKQAATSNRAMTPSESKAFQVAGLSFFLIFILFFAGALASCVGGYCGISRCHSDENGHPRM